jgi:hypothetical protein
MKTIKTGTWLDAVVRFLESGGFLESEVGLNIEDPNSAQNI